jgi:Ni/Fe-hydrogenase subunit HybB-like protein
MIALGALYTLLAVFVHLSIASDLAVSLVPGWHSAVVPPYHIASGFEAAVALVVLGLAATNVPGRHVMRTCAKLLLAFALLWFYFVWCELLTNWYGRTPDEQSLLSLFMFGPGFGLFTVSALCNCFIPASALLWDSARGSRTVVTCIAAIVLFGNLVDRIRLFVGAWSVATQVPADHLPDQLAPIAWPGPLETLACIGIFAIAGLLAIALLSRNSPVSEWELKAVARLTPERSVLRTRTTVVARPG